MPVTNATTACATKPVFQGAGLGANTVNTAAMHLCLYLPHRPALKKYLEATDITALQNGEIEEIIAGCGNHWRKILVIFAKLAAALDARQLHWKTYLHEHLLQAHSAETLIFCENPQEIVLKNQQLIHIFSGKQCAETAEIFQHCHERSAGFYQYANHPIFVTPYFDYRQLSNAKIEVFVQQLRRFSGT